ncbi:MAG: MoaD/ThiS family protein [Chloroflexota bacterium]
MQITIRLLASYRQYLPRGHDADTGYTRQIAPGTRLAEVLPDLPIPQTHACTFFVNGRHAERDQLLNEGDVLSVFPAVGGG